MTKQEILKHVPLDAINHHANKMRYRNVMPSESLPMTSTPRILLATLSLLTGCAPVVVESHVVTANHTGHPNAVFVFDASPDATMQYPSGTLADAVSQALIRCHVRSRAYTRNNMRLNDDRKMKADLAIFQPDAVLILQLVEMRVSGILQGTYLLLLEEVPQKRTIWKARLRDATGGPLFNSGARGMADFASTIASEMAHDGLLASCPGSDSNHA